jgi:SOS-response transcriptional repressor LexA
MARKRSSNYYGVLMFISGYTFGHHGRAPTIREIRDGTAIKSTSHVKGILQQLEEDGVIEYSPRISRGIVLLEKPGTEAAHEG